jgi:hypothetical protein
MTLLSFTYISFTVRLDSVLLVKSMSLSPLCHVTDTAKFCIYFVKFIWLRGVNGTAECNFAVLKAELNSQYLGKWI